MPQNQRRRQEQRAIAGSPASAWTPADQAELDVLAWELVDSAYRHRERCEDCQARRPCLMLAEAVEIVASWRQRRLLLTAAEQLRAEHDALERRPLTPTRNVA